MAYINQPPDLRQIFADLDSRLRKLETATRFTSPDVSTDPTYPRTGDIWYNTTTNSLRTLLTTIQTIATSGFATIFTALQTFLQGINVSNGATVTTGDLTVSAGNINATIGNVNAVGVGATINGTKLVAVTNGVEIQAGGLAVTAGGATITAGGLSVNGGTTAVGTFDFSTTSTATTVGAAGGASALPATPLGYLIVKVAGTDRKIPYYNT